MLQSSVPGKSVPKRGNRPDVIIHYLFIYYLFFHLIIVMNLCNLHLPSPCIKIYKTCFLFSVINFTFLLMKFLLNFEISFILEFKSLHVFYINLRILLGY